MYLNYRDLDADVIVLGAGITGLSAAFHLLEKDPHLDVLILDVDDNYEPENLKLNEKIEQFCSSKQKTLMKLLKKLHIKLLEYSENGKTLVDYDKLYEISGRKNIIQFLAGKEALMLEKLCDQIDNLSRKASLEYPTRFAETLQYDNITMENLLNDLTKNKKIADVITQTFLINTGLCHYDVSALFFLAYCNSIHGIRNQFHSTLDGLHQFQIEGGFEALKSKICKILGKETLMKIPKIHEISWDNYCVGIKTKQGYFFGRRLIYTLNEDQTKKISFFPPLSQEKITISNSFVVPILKKFEVTYKKPFWTEKNLSGNVYVMNSSNKNGPIKICSNFPNIDIYTLSGLAEKNCNKSDVINQLVHYFGDDAKFFENYQETHAEFSVNGLKSMNSFENIRENTEKIIWASPETAKEWYGTLAGSVDAGFKGALRVLYDLKPNILNYDDLQSLSPVQVVLSSTIEAVPELSLNKWYIIVPSFLLALLAVVKLGIFVKKRIKFE